jgi:hypothetical protein
MTTPPAPVQQVHRRRQGDTRTVLPVTLQQPDSAGVLQPVNLTGLSVTFTMINAATSATKVSAASATIVTAASGTVNYDFASGDVDTPGVYWGTFTVIQSGETDAFPVASKGLKILVDGLTKTAEEAYAEAIS